MLRHRYPGKEFEVYTETLSYRGGVRITIERGRHRAVIDLEEEDLRRGWADENAFLSEVIRRIDEEVARMLPSPFRFRIGTRNAKRWQREPHERYLGKHRAGSVIAGMMGFANELARSGVVCQTQTKVEFDRVNGRCP